VLISTAMQKAKKFDLASSNVAGLGSKENRELKAAAAKTEKAWEGAGKVVGTQIWRIESFKVVHWPKDQYGKFYSGDSYIVLHTYKKTPDSAALAYNVHFWLGEKTSQDEMGTAAYKTVELDDLLGDVPVQYREVQGSESETFMAIFKGKITIMEGGVDSGFKHVKPEEYKARLMHLKGKKNVRVTEVPCKRESLNQGDVFILDAGLKIWQWNGAKAAIAEKRKAAEVLNGLKDERNGKPKSKIIDGTEDDEEFWKLLGGKGEIQAEIPDDVKAEPPPKSIWCLSDASGKLTVEEKASGKGNIKKSILKSEDVFFLDTGATLYVWVGSGTSKNEKAFAMQYATDFLKGAGRPLATPVLRVIEGNEPAAFNREFDG
jgi:gelsolin